MIVIRDCCDVHPNIDKFIDGSGISIWCPICGYTVKGDTVDDALQQWNDHRNGAANGS